MLKNVTKIISLAVVLVMVFAGLAIIMPSLSAQVTNEKAPEMTIADPTAVYDNIQFKVDKATSGEAAQIIGYGPQYLKPGDIYDVGAKALFRTGSSGKWFYNGTDYSPLTTHNTSYMIFTKRAETNHSEIWVADDLSFFPGDPRNDNPGKYFAINDTNAQYMADQFENQIYLKMTAFFGPAPARDGENSQLKDQGLPYFGTNITGRVMIMIYNIVDSQDPVTSNFMNPLFGTYTAGSYGSSATEYYDRNIINMDSYDWKNRTGPQPGSLSRPYLYEGVVAHEYQHLLNDVFNPDQAAFLNEGCADYAINLSGYPVPFTHILYFLATPDNSLTTWGDQGDYNSLADYGAAALFVIWISDHFGSNMIYHLVNTTDVGIAAVNSAFEKTGNPGWDFNKAFNYWRLANLIRSDSPGRGMYNYQSIDLSIWDYYLYIYTGYEQGIRVLEYQPYWYSWIPSRAGWYGQTPTLDGYPVGTGDLGSYSTDYIQVTNPYSIDWATYMSEFELKFGFEGQLKALSGWRQTQIMYNDNPVNVWWSDSNDQIDWQLWGSANLSGMTAPKLTIDTMYDIENGWDFAFVQVSTDGGQNWISLANQYTSNVADPDVMESIAANLPGLTGSTDGLFVKMDFDLSAYAGQEIMYRFRYMTDWNLHYGGWYLRDISISGTSVDWSTLSSNSPEPQDTNFMVTIYCPGGMGTNGVYMLPIVMNLDVNFVSEQTLRTLTSLTAYPSIYIIISPQNGPADYGFGIYNAGNWMD